MLDFKTSYIEAGETFEAIKVPLKASLLFRNYGHTIPRCDAMITFHKMWLSRLQDHVIGFRKEFTESANECDAKAILSWNAKMREFLPKKYKPLLYDRPESFSGRKEVFDENDDGHRKEIDCSLPIDGMEWSADDFTLMYY